MVLNLQKKNNNNQDQGKPELSSGEGYCEGRQL